MARPAVPGAGLVEPHLQPPADAAGRRTERMERRELLYAVVRDAMVRAGVLSAGYKFKVLSLDQRGQRFLAMVDLAREYGGETVRLSEIEALIVQTAKTRFDIEVTAVYWRISDQVPAHAGVPAHAASAVAPASASAPSMAPVTPPLVVVAPVVRPPRAAAASSQEADALAHSRSAPVGSGGSVGSVRGPAVAVAAAAAAGGTAMGTGSGTGSHTAGRTDPIQDDEVAAFKRALLDAAASRQGALVVSAPVPASAAAGMSPAPAMLPGESVRTGPVGPALSGRTGFEDTELPAPDTRPHELSNTQFGQL